MAVLEKEKFFSALHEKFGTDTSEESMNFVEDMMDTYNDLEKKANGDGENWEQKYHDLDKAWRDKYRHRFFSSGGGEYNPTGDSKGEEDEYDPEAVTFNSLFKKK